MFSLSYSAAYDPYHTVFRFLVLLSVADDGSITRETLRVCDFYMCFPWFLDEFSAPRTLVGFAARRNAIVRRYPKTPYDVVPDKTVLFDRMEAFQALAWETLIAKGLIHPSDASAGIARLVSDKVPHGLLESIQAYSSKNKELITLLSKEIPLIKYYGDTGIKQRSGLMEYRYDNV
jgi:hypothetical protein